MNLRHVVGGIAIVAFVSLSVAAGRHRPKSGQPIVVALGGKVNMAFVPVSPGTFQMGANDGTGEQKPAHRVTISKPFWMGKYEVTNEQYRRFVETTGYDGAKEAEKSYWSSYTSISNECPVFAVSWSNAMAFCRWMTAQERAAGLLPDGYEYRLPTEAEWEYAARGATRTRGMRYAGSNDADDVAWYGANSDFKAVPVGLKQPNELGLYDMSGNVWEWCYDWYGSDYYSHVKSTTVDPVNTNRTAARAVRGGGVGNFDVSSACRGGGRPAETSDSLGFRVCLAPRL